MPKYDDPLDPNANQYTIAIRELPAGDGASFQTDTEGLGAQNVTVTVHSDNTLTYSAAPVFTNVFSGEEKTGSASSLTFPQTQEIDGTLYRAYGWFDTVQLLNSGSDLYTWEYKLPVGGKAATVVHIFEMDSDGYTFKEAAFEPGAAGSGATFIQTAEGGVLTVPAGTAADTELGTVTITNTRDPDPIDVRLQAKVTLTAESASPPASAHNLPAGNYPFAVELEDDDSKDVFPATVMVPASGGTDSASAVSGACSFTLTKAGTYTFTAMQYSGRDLHIGYYDGGDQTVTVDVGYDGNGDLTISSVSGASNVSANLYEITFGNTYLFGTLAPVLEFSKRFALRPGTAAPAGVKDEYDFSFVLQRVDPAAGSAGETKLAFGAPTAAGETLTGSVTGTPFTLSTGTTASYTLSEQKPADPDPRITYSDATYLVTFTVGTDGETVTVTVADGTSVLLEAVPLEALDEALLTRTLHFENLYAGTPLPAPPAPWRAPPEPQEDTEHGGSAAAAAAALRVPRTADDMPLGALRALFAASVAGLAALGVLWHRRRKSK